VSDKIVNIPLLLRLAVVIANNHQIAPVGNSITNTPGKIGLQGTLMLLANIKAVISAVIILIAQTVCLEMGKMGNTIKAIAITRIINTKAGIIHIIHQLLIINPGKFKNRLT
jgi:hypothetical protein